MWAVASCNDDVLPESTAAETVIDYVEISDVSAVAGIKGSSRIQFGEAPSRARRLVRHGDTILSTVRTYLRAIAKVDSPSSNTVVSTGFAVLRPTDVDADYFSYVLRSSFFINQVVASSKGVSYPAINASEVHRFKVPLPSSIEQRGISAYLEHEIQKIDLLLGEQRRLVSLLREKKRALVTSAVTQGVKQSRTKSPNVDYWGDVPAHWSRHKLKRILVSSDYGISDALSRDIATPVLRMSNLNDGQIDYTDLKFCDEVPETLLLQVGDLLFNRTNSPDLVGQVALVEALPYERVGFASYLVRLRTSNKVSPAYLNYLLNSEPILRFARRLAFGSINQSNLNPTRFGELVLYLPDEKEQAEIVEVLADHKKRINDIVVEAEKAIALMVERREALISAAVTGVINAKADILHIPEAA